jgi:hypothetical protein
MSFDSLLTERLDVISVAHSRDATAGMVPSYTVKYSYKKTRHQETMLPPGPPNEIGGAPTLVNVHQFFLRNPGPILTSDVVIDERGRMLRTASVPNERRTIGGMTGFLTVTCRETQGEDSVATIVLLDPDGHVLRDPQNELLLEAA